MCVMQPGSLGACTPNIDPYYAKCYDGISPSPLNDRRSSFVSQLGTTAIDSSLPQITPVTNVSACLGMNM